MGDSTVVIRRRARDPGIADKRRARGSSAIMRIRSLIPTMLVFGASAVAIAAAPLAEAAPSCTFTGGASVCQSPGNSQVSATPPPVDYQAEYPFLGDVLIFHHDGRR
jgi:hypothetical protein